MKIDIKFLESADVLAKIIDELRKATSNPETKKILLEAIVSYKKSREAYLTSESKKRNKHTRKATS